MARGRLILAATAGLVLIASAPAFAQTPLGDPLDDHSAKRLDRSNKLAQQRYARHTRCPVYRVPFGVDVDPAHDRRPAIRDEHG